MAVDLGDQVALEKSPCPSPRPATDPPAGSCQPPGTSCHLLRSDPPPLRTLRAGRRRRRRRLAVRRRGADPDDRARLATAAGVILEAAAAAIHRLRRCRRGGTGDGRHQQQGKKAKSWRMAGKDVKEAGAGAASASRQSILAGTVPRRPACRPVGGPALAPSCQAIGASTARHTSAWPCSCASRAMAHATASASVRSASANNIPPCLWMRNIAYGRLVLELQVFLQHGQDELHRCGVVVEKWTPTWKPRRHHAVDRGQVGQGENSGDAACCCQGAGRRPRREATSSTGSRRRWTDSRILPGTELIAAKMRFTTVKVTTTQRPGADVGSPRIATEASVEHRVAPAPAGRPGKRGKVSFTPRVSCVTQLPPAPEGDGEDLQFQAACRRSDPARALRRARRRTCSRWRARPGEFAKMATSNPPDGSDPWIEHRDAPYRGDLHRAAGGIRQSLLPRQGLLRGHSPCQEPEILGAHEGCAISRDGLKNRKTTAAQRNQPECTPPICVERSRARAPRRRQR